MFEGIAQWPAWLVRLTWTAGTIAVAYAIGHALNAIVLGRLRRLAPRTRGDWDDVVIAEIKRRVPLWSVLVGAWLSLGHWELRSDVHTLATRVLVALAGLSITLTAAAIAGRLIVSYGATVAPSVPVSRLTQNVARLLIVIVGVLVILNQLGLSITPMLTALGVGGLAVALALQDPLSNLFAGVFLSISGQVRIGDYVKLDSGVEGFVTDFDWRSTRIRVLANNIVIVPNAKLAQSTVTNYSMPDQHVAVGVAVGVDYASDLEHVERVAVEVGREVMRDVAGGVPEFEPAVRFQSLGPSSVNFSVGLKGRQFVDQYLLVHEYVKRLHVRFNREGIVIPFPVQALTTRGALPVRLEPPVAPQEERTVRS
jgi:small-conductance mechanosensitive channel